MRISDNGAVEKILKAIADPENIRIMTRIRKEAKSAQALSAETGIPQSSVYRKLDELRDAGLIMTQHFTVTAGKKVDFLIVSFSELRTVLEDDRLVVDIIPSDDTANIRWLNLFRGG